MSGFVARSRVASALVTLAVAMGVQAISSSQVANAVPSADGARVAFVKVVGGLSQIYTMNPDGTDVEALSNQPTGAGVNNTDPASSPNGKMIAFTSNSGGSGDLNVWVIGLDGSGLLQLTTDPGADSAPAWSPNGATIAYQSDTGGNLNIWLMNAADGTGQHALTTNPASDSQPAWFPTGSRIAFQSNRSGNSDIWAINSNGTSLKHVTTSTAPDTQPSVGPGGGTIAFTSRRNGNTDIYTVPAGGGTNTRVTSNAAVDSQPAFSTDGRSLAFTSNRTGINQVFADPRPTGTAKQLTTDTVNPASEADYSPYAYPSPAWTQRLTGSSPSVSNLSFAMAESPDGTKVFIAGGVVSKGADVRGFLAAYSAAGAFLWKETYTHTVLRQSFGGAYAVAVSPDGSTVYVGGYAGAYAYIGAYNASDGALQQSTLLPCGGWNYPTIYTMAVSPDGADVIAAGTCYGSTGLPAVAFTVSLAQGSLATQWDDYLDKSDPAGGSMHFSPDGTAVYWTGIRYGTPVSDYMKENYVTMAFRVSDGAGYWEKTYNGPGNGQDDPWALGVSPDGSTVYVTGNSYGGSVTKSDMATIAYSAATGDTVWSSASRYDSPNHGWDGASALAVSPDGSTIYITGTRSRTVNGKLTYDFLTASLAASDGSVNWATAYNGPGDYTGTNNFDEATSVEVSPDGDLVYVTGGSYRTGTSFDMTSVAYDSSGDQIMIARYDGPSHKADYSYASALSPDGSTLYATGPSSGTSAVAGGTVAWDVGSLSGGPVQRFEPVARSSGIREVQVARAGPSVDGIFAGMRLKLRMEAFIRGR